MRRNVADNKYDAAGVKKNASARILAAMLALVVGLGAAGNGESFRRIVCSKEV